MRGIIRGMSAGELSPGANPLVILLPRSKVLNFVPMFVTL